MVFYTDSAIAKEGFSANYTVSQSSVSEGQYLRLLQSPAVNSRYYSSSHTCGPVNTTDVFRELECPGFLFLF